MKMQIKKEKRMKKAAYFFITFFVFILTYNLTSAGYGIYLTAGDKQTEEQEAVSRLKEISKKKEEMRLELEKLRKEEEQLKGDIEREGRLMPVRKKRELEHRSRELEERIKSFIEDLEKLNQEEQQLLGTQKPM